LVVERTFLLNNVLWGGIITNLNVRILDTFKHHLKQEIPAGFFGGALGGGIEALYLAINYGYLRTTLFSAGIFYYSLLGATVCALFSLVVSLILIPWRKDRELRDSGPIYFAATTTYLLLPTIAEFIFKRIVNASPKSFVGMMIITFSIFMIWSITFGLHWSFKALSKSLLGWKWRQTAFIGYLLALVLTAIGWVLIPPPKDDSQPIDPVYATLSGEKPNIILIVIDALRQDWLSPYGDKIIATPNIQRFADKSVLFTNAFSNCSWTKPSFASIFTSLYPTQHNVTTGRDKLNPKIVTLAETLRKMGYYTIGYYNNPHLRTSVSNFNLGFNHYEYLIPNTLYPMDQEAPKLRYSNFLNSIARRIVSKERVVSNFYQDAATTSQTLIDWLSHNGEKRFFLFVHYMDPHEPYFERPLTGRVVKIPKIFFSTKELERVSKAYRGEIEFVDESLGKLFDYLEESGIQNNTLVILTADHGEEFYDHGGWSHGKTLFNEVIRVPFIVKLPHSERAGAVDSSLVQLIDVAPTAVRFVGGEIPSEWEGKDIFSGDKTIWSLSVLGNGRSLRNLAENLYLADEEIQGSGSPTHYYLIKDDPKEMLNLAADPAYFIRISELRDTLRFLESRLATKSVKPIEAEIQQSTKDRLKALGYAE